MPVASATIIQAILGGVAAGGVGLAGSAIANNQSKKHGMPKIPGAFRPAVAANADRLEGILTNPAQPFLGPRIAPMTEFQIANGGALAQLALGANSKIQPTTGPMSLRPLTQDPNKKVV